MRYKGVNRVSPRGAHTHVALIRTLRSYLERHLLDLVDTNKFEPIVGEGADDYGRDDVVERHNEINAQRFQFHIESSDQDDETKPCGLLGVPPRRHWTARQRSAQLRNLERDRTIGTWRARWRTDGPTDAAAIADGAS
jgi:hypothetical protein